MKYFYKKILQLFQFFVIITFILYFQYSFISKNSNKAYCLSLIIPSTENDFLRCYKQFFYLYKSFAIAKEIIIVISSVTNKTKIKEIIFNLAIKNKIILSLSKSTHFASYNRNYGFLLSKCQIISYFDMDDIMSINRLPLLYTLFKYEPTTEFVLHKYSSNCNITSPTINVKDDIRTFIFNISYSDIYNSYISKYQRDKPYKRWCCKYIDILKHESIHNGWPTMRRYILERIKYNDSYKTGQDVDFNTNVIINNFNVTILNYSLGYYKRDNRCRNYYDCIKF